MLGRHFAGTAGRFRVTSDRLIILSLKVPLADMRRQLDHRLRAEGGPDLRSAPRGKVLRPSPLPSCRKSSLPHHFYTGPSVFA